MLMSPKSKIDPVFRQEILHAPPVEHGQSDSCARLKLGAVIPVIIGAVHRAVAVDDNPGGQTSVHL